MVANYSLYTLPATILITYYPHFYKGYLVKRQTGKWNNIQPRENIIKAEKQMSLDVWNKARRCEAAHQNGLENFPIFASAVIVANLAGVPSSTVNLLSTSFVISRIIYNLIYIKNDSASLAGLRSLVWATSMGISFALFILAARKGLPHN